MHVLNNEGKSTNHHQVIANAFNIYFLLIAEKINTSSIPTAVLLNLFVTVIVWWIIMISIIISVNIFLFNNCHKTFNNSLPNIHLNSTSTK
jgi:hypothetical protein